MKLIILERPRRDILEETKKQLTMKHSLNTTALLLALMGAMVLGCKKEKALLPSVTTFQVTEITQNDLVARGEVTDDGGASLKAMGFCWGINPSPTVEDSVTITTPWVGAFENHVTGLIGGTTYYIRSYATNSVGTSYGGTLTFTTLAAELPHVWGRYPENITQTSVQMKVWMPNDGGAPTTWGVCWGISENPTVADSKTVDGQGEGDFLAIVTGLSASTTYYLRAYATNKEGTAYDRVHVVRTMHSKVTDIDGNVYQTVLIGSQEWMAENLRVTHYRNGDPIANVTDSTSWASTAYGAWSSYNNDLFGSGVCGLLYNRYAITDSREVCPSGWHLPSDAEWIALIDYLGGDKIAYNKIFKPVDSYYYYDRNSSGFSAVYAGWRTNRGKFKEIDHGTFWWPSTKNSDDYYVRGFVYNIYPYRFNYQGTIGLSVRCLKD